MEIHIKNPDQIKEIQDNDWLDHTIISTLKSLNSTLKIYWDMEITEIRLRVKKK